MVSYDQKSEMVLNKKDKRSIVLFYSFQYFSNEVYTTWIGPGLGLFSIP